MSDRLKYLEENPGLFDAMCMEVALRAAQDTQRKVAALRRLATDPRGIHIPTVLEIGR